MMSRNSAPAASARRMFVALAITLLLAASLVGLWVLIRPGGTVVPDTQTSSSGCDPLRVQGEPMSVPSAPRDLRAEAEDLGITLTWRAPRDNGGLPLLGYNLYRGTSSGAEDFYIAVVLITTFIDLLVDDGVTYYYQVTAFNLDGEGARSNEASATAGGDAPPPPEKPGAPTGLVAAGRDGRIDLTWSPPDNGGSPITNYHVHRGTAPDGESRYRTVGDVQAYADSDVTNGLTYYYKVSAENDVGEGSPSNEASATPEAPPGTTPSAPRDLRASAGDAIVNLDWSPPADDGGSPVTNYRIYRGTVPGHLDFLATVSDVLSYQDTGVTNGVTYHYRVSAVNSAGEGPRSGRVDATPTATPSAPGAVRDLRAETGDRRIELSWSPPAHDGGEAITNYRIYRTTSGGDRSHVITVGNVTSYADAGLSNGQCYYYVVAAVNAIGEGPPSDQVSATPATLPSAPRFLLATAGNRSVRLDWSPPTDDGGSPIQNYTVYRGTAPTNMTRFAGAGTALTLFDATVTNHVTYYYAVTAANDRGEGPRSSLASVTPTAEPRADATSPTIIILTPTQGSSLRPGPISVTGTASDDVGVEQVDVSQDGSNWTMATGTSEWAATLNLEEGNWTIYARAIDSGGNAAIETVSVTVTSSPGEGGPNPETRAAEGDFGMPALVAGVIFFAVTTGVVWFFLERRRKV